MNAAETQLRQELAEVLHNQHVRIVRNLLAVLEPLVRHTPRTEHREAWKAFDGELARNIKKFACLQDDEVRLPLWHADEVLALLRDLGLLPGDTNE